MPLGLRPIARENYSLGKAALFLFQDFNAYRHSSNTITALKTLGEDIRLYRQTRTQLLPAAAHTRTGAELTSYMRGTLERAYIGALDARGQHPNLPGFVRDREEHFTRWLDETVLADYHLQLSKALTNPPKTLNLSDINSFGNANFGHGTWFEAADGKKITSYNPLLIEEGDQRFLYLARDAAVEKSEQIPIKELRHKLIAQQPERPLSLVFHKFASVENAVDFTNYKIDVEKLRVGQLENVLNLHYDNPLMNARFFDFAPPITERTAEKLATIPRTALFKMKYGSPIRQITKYYPYRLHRTIFGEDAEQRLWFHPSDEAKFNAREARLVRDGLALEEEAAKAAGPLKRMFRFSHAACVFKILGPAVGFYIAYKALDKAREFYAKENGLGSRTLYAASDGLVDVVSAMWSPDLSGYSAELAKSLLHKGIDRLEKNKFSGYPEKQYFC